MPYRDGTGPSGFGSRTGRGRGRCGLFSTGGAGFSPRRIGFLGSLIPVVAAVVRDLINPYGLLRSTGRKLIARKPDDLRKPVDTPFTVLEGIDSKSLPATEKKKIK